VLSVGEIFIMFILSSFADTKSVSMSKSVKTSGNIFLS